MNRGLTITLSWVVALGLIGLALIFGGEAKNVGAQMMSPSPSPSSGVQAQSPAPTSSPALSPYPSPDEKGVCFVDKDIACESGTTRQVCEEDLQGIFYVGGRCPKEAYRDCNGGMVTHDEKILVIENCDTKTNIDIFNEFQKRFSDAMVKDCHMMSELRQCVFSGTYVGPYMDPNYMYVSSDGKNCQIKGEAWYRCVRTGD